MKYLFLSIPTIESYFNAGHHLKAYECSAYISKKFNGDSCRIIDGSSMMYTWMDLGRIFVNRYDVIFLFCDYDSLDLLDRTLYYIREISPQTKIMCYGRIVPYVKEYLQKKRVDVLAISGDYEKCIEEYIMYLKDHQHSPKGCLVRVCGKYVFDDTAGFLNEDEIVFPNIGDVPFEQYYNLYKEEDNRFCGIPNKKELVVYASRGCPIGCKYCEVSEQQGTKERRKTVDSVIEYIKKCYDKREFDYVTFYSAIFTLDADWVYEFCEKIKQIDRKIEWKCTTSVFYLDESIVRIMSEANCFRISVGIECLDFGCQECIPKCKRMTSQQLLELKNMLKKYNVELNCFIMLDAPGNSYEDCEKTLNFLKENNIRFRPTVYTPYYHMREKFDESNVYKFNRQLFMENSNYSIEEKMRLYEYIYGGTK